MAPSGLLDPPGQGRPPVSLPLPSSLLSLALLGRVLVVAVRHGRRLVALRGGHAQGAPEGLLIVLPPLLAIMIKGHLGRVSQQLRQRLDGAARPTVPVAGEHAVSKGVPATVAAILLAHRVLIPAQLTLQSQETPDAVLLDPRLALAGAEQRPPRAGRCLLEQPACQFGHLRTDGNLTC